MQHWEIILFFFVIACVYASVGFGGGSSYLAVLTFYALPFQEMKLTALICNIIVVTGGTIIFVKKKQLNWKRVVPLVAASVPMAFIGAALKIKQETFFIILGCSLITAAVLLWMKTSKEDATGAKNVNDIVQTTHSTSPPSDRVIRAGSPSERAGERYLLGAAIGFLSGMVGIGGGIFLAPVLHLMKWDDAKKIAATASFFILVNSVAGIAGQLTSLPAGVNFTRIGLLCVAVFAGGQIGARLGAVKFDAMLVRRVTAIVVFIAGTEVLWKHIPAFK